MSKVKVQITIDEGLLQELDSYCDANYMNRSWAISQAVLQLVNSQKIIDSVMNLSLAIKIAAEKGTIDDETKKQMESFETLVKMVTGK